MGIKSAQRQYIVTVSGISGTFAQKSGGDISADAAKIYDGGSLTPDVLAGPAEVGNITVTRSVEHARDAATLKTLRSKVGQYEATITVTPTDANLVTLGSPVIYPKALLIGFTELEADASSGEAATYSLEFLVPRVT